MSEGARRVRVAGEAARVSTVGLRCVLISRGEKNEWPRFARQLDRTVARSHGLKRAPTRARMLSLDTHDQTMDLYIKLPQT